VRREINTKFQLTVGISFRVATFMNAEISEKGDFK
jgi:hypothetical protein